MGYHTPFQFKPCEWIGVCAVAPNSLKNNVHSVQFSCVCHQTNFETHLMDYDKLRKEDKDYSRIN
jgi:hypothetical protein